jgi:hypothetical protein
MDLRSLRPHLRLASVNQNSHSITPALLPPEGDRCERTFVPFVRLGALLVTHECVAPPKVRSGKAGSRTAGWVRVQARTLWESGGGEEWFDRGRNFVRHYDGNSPSNLASIRILGREPHCRLLPSHELVCVTSAVGLFDIGRP